MVISHLNVDIFDENKILAAVRLCLKVVRIYARFSIFKGNKMAVATVLDFEWKFGVTAATSESDKVGSSYLHMKITLAPASNSPGDKPQNVHFEMSLPQFYEFLHELEKAKSSLDYMP